MKKLLLLLIWIGCAAVPTGFSLTSFEGQYDMELDGDGESVLCSFWVKDGNMRMIVSQDGEQAGEMIFRNGVSEMIMIMPQQRMYMEIPVPMEQVAAESGTMESGDFPFKKTGKTKDILGYKAHEFLSEDNGEKMIIWATEDLGAMVYAENPILQGWANAMRKMSELSSFFPLETIGYENGKESFRMTVKKVDKKSLEDSLFQPPQGYMKMTLPAGMGGFMPGG